MLFLRRISSFCCSSPWVGLLSLGLLGLGGCGQPDSSAYQGYVEADLIHVSSPFSGRMLGLTVKRGDPVAAGAPLYRLESEQEAARESEAEGALQRARSQLANLEKGKRPTEIAALEASRRQIAANLALAEADLKRDEGLFRSGFISDARMDDARTKVAALKANLANSDAQLATARLGARSDEIAAAKHDVAVSEAALKDAAWQKDQKGVSAPLAGTVYDIYYRPGEWLAPGTPALSILSPDYLKVRFFVPEPRLGSLRLGQPVKVSCDGCQQPLQGEISFIAPDAQYTPPVIYSNSRREKLTYMIEAHFQPEAAKGLHPGQPVDVAVE